MRTKRFLGLFTCFVLLLILLLLSPYILTKAYQGLTTTPSLVPLSSITPTWTPALNIVKALTVNKLTDTNDGSCDTRDCSLREAISNAGGGKTISFSPSLVGTIILTQKLVVDKDLTIAGTGPKSSVIVISGNNTTGVFEVEKGVTLNLDNLTVADGRASIGGAIANLRGTVNLTNSTLMNNSATSGGAVLNIEGIVTISNSTLMNNSATSGGAISNGRGTVKIINTTLAGNKGLGGAVNNAGGTVTLTSSTLAKNNTDGGGSIFNYDLIPTPKFRTPTPPPTVVPPGTVELANTIVSIESSDISNNLNCRGSVIDRGGNLQFPTNDCGASISVGDPKLGPLQDNGGPTWTMTLQPGSTAIGKGSSKNCPSVDQRGFARLSTMPCDIGAITSITVSQ